MDFSKDQTFTPQHAEPQGVYQPPQTSRGSWGSRGGRGGRGGGFSNFNQGGNFNQSYQQNPPSHQQTYTQSSYQSNQPQQWAPPAGVQTPPVQGHPTQSQPPPSWAPPQQQTAPISQGPPKIFVRADGCDAFLDLRVILPSDRFPNINWGGRVIGSKGATIKMLQNEHNVKINIKDRRKNKVE